MHLQGWSLKFISDGRAKYKEKVPDVSDPNQNLETTCNSKLKFTELVKDELPMYAANIAILKLSAEDITLDYGFLLRLVNTFTIDTDEYYSRCYKVNDTKTCKNLLASNVYCRLAHLTGALKNHVDLVLCIIRSD